MSDDAILIERILAGNQSAFETLVQRYKGTALAMAMQYVSNFHDAQDITQEAFFSAYIHLPKLKDPSRFKSWFFQIVINHAKMFIRTQMRRTQREEISALDWIATPVEHERFVESLAWREIIQKAVESLSPSNQAIVTLYFFGDGTSKEVADALGLPVGTVKRRLHEIRKVLRKEIRIMLNEQGTLKHRVGIETLGGILTPFFEKATPLPVQKAYTFTTAEDNQQEIDIHIAEGDAAFVSECRSLGRIVAKDFSIGPKGTPEIAITFSIEKDGSLSIDAVEKKPNEKRVTIKSKTKIETVSIQVP